MAKSRDNIALEWTRAELIETLGCARRTLEAYALVQDAGEASQPAFDLTSCVDALHQVHGVFVMLELEAAATFAAHLESVARALVAGSLADPAGAAECLMQGLLELPDYFDALRAGLGDTIAPLLPVLNELRRHLREPPFAPPEVSLAFASAPSEGALQRFAARNGLDKVRKVRAIYQQTLLSALKGGIAAPAVSILEKVALSMQRLCEGTPAAVLWQTFDEYLHALRDSLGEQPGALGGEAVKLLRRVDSELRLIAQDGAEALARPVRGELLQQLASAATARGRTSQFLAELQQAIAASDMSEALASSGRRALSSAAAALRDDLGVVRDRVDLALRRGSDDEPIDLPSILVPLKRISSTMSMLGLESSRAIIAEQIGAITGAAADADALAAAAEALEQVDRNLAGLSQGTKDEVELILDAAQQAVLTEARNGLELLKQGIVDYVSSHWDVRHLQSLPEHLAGIANALRIIPLVDAASLVDQCVGYLVHELLAGHVPDWRELDRFAGAISGVDYYLERLAVPGGAGADEILAQAQQSVAQLLVEREPAVAPVPTPAAGVVAPALEITPDIEPEQAAEEILEVEARAAAEFEDDEPSAAWEALDLAEAPEPERAPPPGVATQPEPAVLESAAPQDAAAHARLANLRDQFEVEGEILAVFLEEVEELLAAIDSHLAPWQSDPAEGQHVMDMRRAFHTLKGSARLVGANVLGELGWAIEHMLNRVLDGAIDASPELFSVLATARAVVPELRAAFSERRVAGLAAAADVIGRAERVAAGQVETEIAFQPSTGERTEAEPSEVEPAGVEPETLLPVAEARDALDEFRDEAREHLAVLTAARETAGYRLDESAARALHTLAGNAAMVGESVITDLARAALDLVQGLLGIRESMSVTGPAAECLDATCAALAADLEQLGSGVALAPHPELVAKAEQLSAQAPGVPLIADLLELPGLDTLLGAEHVLSDWQRSGFDAGSHEALMQVLQDIRDLAAGPDLEPIAALVTALLDAQQRLAGSVLEAVAKAALLTGYERLLAQIDALVAGQPLRAVPETVSALDGLGASLSPVESAGPVETFGPAVSEPLLAVAEAAEPAAIVPSGVPQTAVAEEPVAGAVDDELIGIFLEEAEELLDAMDRAVQGCASQAEPHASIEALLRALHTLKGGARLAGLIAAGDAAHEFESWLVALRDAGAAFDAPTLACLHDHYDSLAGLIASVASASARAAAVPVEEADALGASAAEPREDVGQATPLVPTEAASAPAGAPSFETAPGSTRPASQAPAIWYVPVAAQPEAPVPAARALHGGASGEAALSGPAAVAPIAAERRGPEESVRVRASLLEQLVNLAGESSIIRGRVQQGLAEFGGALDEMETTIQRLREQLRRLEIETEAQILFRRERPDSPAYEDFDPLEFDRYSHLQQLSRSLSESASDMLDLKETLRQRAGETETLLVQQSRVNTQLQEGLMRSRMVPFSRLLPRLRRTVRQVAQDLGKSVELVAYNVEGELDRNLLDRMVAPLEHMLRNAVDHGIESIADRRLAGKPETGQIELRVAREAGDVVIEIRDDGAGIDVERVRSKALAEGLVGADAVLSDDELRQFIFAPGFSTARSVTQISGRGVGMDVVLSEVKQLGGSIGVTSEPGRGTAFLVRVPFTVSVNRALMVLVDEDLYAVPLNTIEGIVLVRGDELARLPESAGGTFEYAGVAYQVRHLGEYFGRPVRSGSAGSAVPVVLVRSGDSAVAVQVDGVQGSREIVVKGLGPQFAGLAGISGATILGDGGVVVILDLPALVRARREAPTAGRKRGVSAPHARAVLVVDDSVTVRKVTTRLLERQGMEVMIAKDGVEAVAQLQERKPDIMLLDIEMPRMDGFEVLRHVRHDARLADLPVIMISSRTGAKHKDRAAELGVSHFLGKPFQEAELLSIIDQFLN